jgi:hypothetical protein
LSVRVEPVETLLSFPALSLPNPDEEPERFDKLNANGEEIKQERSSNS